MSGNRQRITILAGFVFVAHVIAIFALHAPEPLRVQIDNFRSRPQLPPIAVQPAPELDGLNDPLVFAGAHEQGFSASAWLMAPKQTYAISNSLPPPDFLSYIRTPLNYPFAETFPHPEPNLPFIEIALAPPARKSIVHVEGALETRPLLRAIEPPIQFASDVLTNSIVEVAVQPDGFPFSARLISSSGSRAADLTALDLSKKARFRPLPLAESNKRADLQWGTLEFQWFTAEPGATNTPGPASRPIISAAK